MVPIYELLSTGPGTFVYHLLILLALEATAGIAFIEYRHTRNPDQRRILSAFSVLFFLRIPLLFGAPLQGGMAPLLSAVLAPLQYGLEVASLTLMWWAFLSPLVGRRAGRAFLIGNLVAAGAAIAAFFPFWYRMVAAVPFFEYAAFWQQIIWDGWATAIALSAMLLHLTYRRRLGYSLPAVAFGLIALGNGLILFDQVGLGRLTNLIGYPLLAVAVYRAALQDLWAYRHELEKLSAGALRQTREHLFLLEVGRALGESLDPEAMLRRVAESVAHALDADRAAVLLAEDDEHLRVAAQFVPLERPEGRHVSTPFPLSQQPLLAHVVRRRKSLLLSPRETPSRLRSLYELLGSREEGPVIIQPLLRQQRVLGVLVVGNDRCKRPFEVAEARLCDSIAPQIAAAIENSRLYRRLAAALAAQEEATGLRDAILESIAEGIIVADAEGHAVMMNAAAEEILGVKRDRVLGRPLKRLLAPATKTKGAELDLPAEPPTPLHAFFELQNRQVQVVAAPVRSPGGQFLGVVAVLRDVTREVQAERAKRDFIATISHELRTPLTAILGYAEVLYDGTVGALTQSQARFVRIIHDNARRMVAMANNMIALAEAEHGRLELEYAETDIPLIVGEVVQAFAPQMEARQLKCSLEIGDDIPLIEADPVRIRQVVSNLVSNAVNYTFPGGHITVGVAMVQEPEPGYCRLWVQDTGIGISPEEQSRIWEQFYRADNPLKIEAGGLGVGLSIVKSLVEAHGGRVWLESVPGEGSTFTVLLPVRRTPSPLLGSEMEYPDLERAVSRK